MNNETPDLFWVQDSSGEHTCHVNDGSTFMQSLIGTLHLRSNKWHPVFNNGEDLSPDGTSYARARILMETTYRKRNPRSAAAAASPHSPDRRLPRNAQTGKV